MRNRRTILIWLIAAFAVGGAIDVLTFNPRGDISLWRLLSFIPILVLLWAWIRVDRHRLGLPMYSRGFTWLLAFLAPVALVYHALKTRRIGGAFLLLAGAVGVLTIATMAGALATILVLSSLGMLPSGL